MAAGVDQVDQPPGGTDAASMLLNQAEVVSAQIRSAAGHEASGFLALAARNADGLVALAVRQAAEGRAAAARRADHMRGWATDDAEAELAFARRRSQEAILVARRAGDRLRETAEEQARQTSVVAERRAEELVVAAASYAAEVQARAGKSSEGLGDQARQVATSRLAAARLGLEQAEMARTGAGNEADLVRDVAARRATEMTDEARQELDMARRVRAFALRDASQVMADAMQEASRSLDMAARQFDAANAMLAEAERGPDAVPAPAPLLTGPTTVADPIQTGPSPAVPEPDVEVPAPEPSSAPAPAPLLVPVLSFGRELVLRLLVLVGMTTTAWFWLWWLATGHGEWTFGSGTASFLLAWVFGLSFYFFFFVCRMSRPNPTLSVPDLRVAMVVTKAPAEAWEVLERTLVAMLTQDYGRPYDVWLADERPALATVRWCLEHGVKVSTRHGVEEYHRRTWPRRTKSKEGNLAWFYDQVGYDKYDVVVQLDADHVPASGYLQAMVRPFVDSRVGYVAAPSICDANAGEGWTVRGRLYREASMHGPVQAGCNGGYAPVCIGSHYAVRTAALRDIGGIGPELAEDYSTTLSFQSGGWDGVFNIDAVAHGDGPATVEEMLVQEVQWSRSLGTILMRWAPERLRTVPWRARPRLAFALLYYPVAGVAVAMAAAAPMLGVLLGRSWGNTSLAAFYIHLWPHTVVSMVLVVYLRRCRLLRPVNGKVWSWELVLFQVVRWPWTLVGFTEGVYAGLRSKVVRFGVTPKSVPGVRALPVRYLVPTLMLGVVPAWVVVAVRDPGPAVGLMVIATLQASVYIGSACLVVALHLLGNRRRNAAAPRSDGAGGVTPWQAGRAATVTTLGVAIPTVGALIWRLWAVGLRG